MAGRLNNCGEQSQYQWRAKATGEVNQELVHDASQVLINMSCAAVISCVMAPQNRAPLPPGPVAF